MKRALAITYKILLSLLMLIILLWMLVHTTSFQNFLVNRITTKLSKDLHAKVSIRHVEFALFNKMLLEGTLILDRKNDTLLYAQAAKVNITDWFFLKDNIVLKYVALENADIHLTRKDSTWNYQFIADYFSSPSKKTGKAKNVIRLDLKTVALDHVRIYQKDEWIGQDMMVAFDKLHFTAEEVDMKKNILRINNLELQHPLYAEYNYIGKRPKKIKKPRNDEPWNPDEWSIYVNRINISRGGMDVERDDGRPPLLNRFDGDHIILSDINGTLDKVQLIRDTLSAKINLSLKDRSGFEIKKIAAAYTLSPRLMEFRDLDLFTNRSHVGNYYAMHYTDFNADMANFEQAVSMEADFNGSDINSNDLAFFSPEAALWQRNFFIAGRVNGTVDNLEGKSISLRSGSSSFNGNFSIRGLPYANETYLNVSANDLHTSYTDLRTFVPSIRNITNPDLAALGNIHYKGNFTGFFNDFVTYGTLQTDLGTLVTDLHMQPRNGPGIYSGKIATDNFQLGRFIRDPSLGVISFNGKISGKGFTASNADVDVDGRIQKLQFNDYTYTHINAHGNIRNNLLKGDFSIDDPNVKIDALSGTIHFNRNASQFNFDANVARLNLKDIGLTNDNFSLTGKFSLNFTGDNIDNFLGYARIYNATLLDGPQKLSFDSLTISSYQVAGKKLLSVQSNELDAMVTGNFRIMELPEAFQLLLNRYYPAYITKPSGNIHAQDFTFNITTKVIDDYISLLGAGIKGFNNTSLSGYLNLSSNVLNVKASVPSFNYNNIDFTAVEMNASGNYDSLAVESTLGDVVINDSLHFPGTKISVTANNDISDVVISTSASKTLNEADLSLRLQTLPNGFRLNFNPSSIVVNDKKWILEKGGQLVLDKKLLTASEVRLVQNEQQIIISTEAAANGTGNDMLIDLKKFNVGDVLPFFLTTPHFDGLLSGRVKVSDPFGKLSLSFVSQVDQFRFENDSIGVLRTSGSYSSLTGDVIANANVNNADYNFIADFTYKTKDSTTGQLNGSLNLDRSNIRFLQKYLNTLFTGLEGNATGQLNITGRARDPKITGSVALNDASLTVNYTRCKYFFNNNSIIRFNRDEIDFGTLRIRDTLNNTATISGKLFHTFFDDFYFNDLHFRTDKRGALPGKFILLHTTAKDNKEFFGDVVGEADMQLDGPITDMRMNITGQPTDSSHIYLPTGDVAETGNINYIEFIKFGREMRTDATFREEVNIRVNMDIIATPFARIDVILDETTGDIIKAQGRGRLNIRAGTKEPLTIRGRFDVEEGQYTFNFQTFLKTPFILQSGYIEWQGDPYLANLNIDAIYKAKNVNLKSIPTSLGNSVEKNDVDVIFKLRGTLKEPAPNFEFQFPFGNPLRSDPIANEYLKTRYQADKNAMNKQVTSLLLFNSFMTDQQSLFSTNNTGNFVFKTVGQVLSSTLSSSLNNWLQKLLKTDQVNLYTNLNTPDFNFAKGGTQKQIQTLGNFGFKTAFLNNRLLINFGGNVDYRLVAASSNSSTNFLFTPDVSFEYLISPSGSLRVVGFNRSDADLGDIAGVTRRNRTGILLSYRKDFNTFYELFGSGQPRK